MDAGRVTVLAVVADGPYLALATDGSARGNPPPHLRQKLHALSARLPLAIACGGVCGGSNWPAGLSLSAVLAQLRTDFDAGVLDPAGYTVGDVAQCVAAEIHATLGHLLPPAGAPGGDTGFTGLVAGYSAGQRQPEVWHFGVLAAGVAFVNVKMHGGAGGALVLPKPIAAEGVRRPRDLEDAVALASTLVQRRIDQHARTPEAGRDAEGPIYTLALTPDGPAAVLAPC
jgi:hypothetical protein